MISDSFSSVNETHTLAVGFLSIIFNKRQAKKRVVQIAAPPKAHILKKIAYLFYNYGR